MNWYDFGKRSLDIGLGARPTMDPLCEKYPWIGPYAYCAGNPMRYVDPDGQDWVAYYDDKGVRKYKWVDGITSAEDITESEDANEHGYEYVGRHMTDILSHAGYQMPDETVTSTSTHQVADRKGNEHEVDMYEIDGNYHGTGLFDFLANATDVEWTHAIFGNTMLNVNGKNYLTTSRKKNTDYGNFVLADMINVVLPPGMRKVPIQRHVHNHPGGDSGPSDNDRTNALNLNLKYPSAEFFIYTKNKYYQYDQYSSFSNRINIMIQP